MTTTDATAASDLYGLMAEYENVDGLVRGIRHVQQAGYKKIDAYTPQPEHAVYDALNIRRTLVPWIVLAGGVAGLLIFIGQAFIQMLMLMFLSDTIEYGQWKLGKRNESITFSVQPFINKIGGAIASGVLGLTLILSGINAAPSPDAVTVQGITLMKGSMLILPLIAIVAGYIVYMNKFTIDEKRYAQILGDLKARGDIAAKPEQN